MLLIKLLVIFFSIYVSLSTRTVEEQNKVCFFRINELFGNIIEGEKSSFIELQAKCTRGKPGNVPLVGYKLIIVQANKITASFMLNQFRADPKGFFVIAGSDVATKGLGYDHQTYAKHSETIKRGKARGLTSHFTTVTIKQSQPFAILLLYRAPRSKAGQVVEDKIWKEKIATSAWPRDAVFQELTPSIEATIKQYLVDAVGVGTEKKEKKCTNMDRIIPLFENMEEYMLPFPPCVTYTTTPASGSQGQNSTVQRGSLSRCTVSTEGFLPQSFKITKPTVSNDNDCENGTPVFMEEQLPLEAPPTSPASTSPAHAQCTPPPSEESNRIPECSVQESLPGSRRSSPVASTSRATSHSFPALIEIEDNNEDVEIDEGVQARYIENVKSRLRTTREGVMDLDGETGATAQANREAKWTQLIANVRRHETVFPVRFFETSKELLSGWVEMNYNQHNPMQSTFKCRKCNAYYNVGHPKLSERYKPDLAFPQGWNGTGKDSIRQKLRDHVKASWHETILDMEENKRKAAIKNAFRRIKDQKYQELSAQQQSTARMFMAVYTETLLHVSFNAHTDIVKMLELVGVDMGGLSGFHRTDKAAHTFVDKISSDFHSTLLRKLNQQRLPFSIMIDSTTDKSGNEVAVVLIQTLQEDIPTVYFYRLLQVGIDCTGKGYVDLVERALREDVVIKPSRQSNGTTMLDIARQQLVGVTTDGASVMTGRYEGFAVLLSEKLKGSKETLYRTHCLAHRLDLVLRHLVAETQDLKDYENNIRDLANFFNNQNSKNVAMLVEVAAVKMSKTTRISYTFDTRWCTSESVVLKRLRNGLPIILIALEGIAAAEHGRHAGQYNAVTRGVARGLLNMVKSRKFVVMTYVMSDIIDIFSIYNLRFQRGGGLVWELEPTRDTLVQSLTALKTQPGKHVAELLSKLKCTARSTSTTWTDCRTLDQVLTAPKVRFSLTDAEERFELTQPSRTESSQNARNPHQITMLINHMIDTAVREINGYFPEETMKDFSVLLPNNFDVDRMKTRTFGTTEMTRLALRFGLSSDLVVTEWQGFCEAFADHPNYIGLTTQGSAKIPAHEFWPIRLRDKEIVIGNSLKRLLRILLTLPGSTASAERAFSTFNLVRNPRRSRLKTSTIESLLRVKINGPQDIRMFPDYKYARAWTGLHVVNPDRKKPGRQATKSGVDITKMRHLFGEGFEEILESEREQAEFEIQERTRLEAFDQIEDEVILQEDNLDLDHYRSDDIHIVEEHFRESSL